MNRILRNASGWGLMSLVLAALPLQPVQSADVPGLPAVEQLAGYVKGESETPIRAVDALIRTATPETLPVIEERLIAVVLSPDSTLDAIRHACRQLKIAGGERTAEALVPGLLDENVSHYIRYALEGNPSPSVDAALLSALRETDGDLRLGMISSLAARRTRRAVRPLARMAASDDPVLAEAAIAALGRIGTPPAARVLNALQTGPEFQVLRADALLRCADRLSATGDAGGVAIYESFLDNPPSAEIQIAALIGIVRADGERALPHVFEQLASDDWQLRATAGRSLADYMPGESVTRAISERVSTLAPETQVVVINALVARNDAATPEAIIKELGSGHIPVRQAAIEALGIVGDTSAIPWLVNFALAGGETGRAAQASLASLPGENITPAILALTESPEADVRALAVETLRSRGEIGAAPRMAALLSDDHADVRRAAIRALTDLGTMEEFRAVIAHLQTTDDAAERRGLSRTASSILDRSEQKAPAMPVLATALAEAGVEVQEELIPVLRFVGSIEAVNATKAFLTSDELALRRAAIRAMSDWPTDEAMADLLQTAKEDENEGNRLLALRGYTQSIGRSGMGAEEKSRRFAAVLDMAPSVDIVRFVLSSVVESASPQLLPIVEAYLNNEELRAEAQLAYIGLAERLRSSDPQEAARAARRVLEETDNEDLQRRARAVIQEIERLQGFIATWLLSGPYAEDNRSGTALMDTVFAPETGDADVEWREVTTRDGWQINLEQLIGGSNRAAYLKAQVHVPVAQRVRLELGSDDQIMVWLNGTLVHRNDVTRSVAQAQDRVEVDLREGWNDLLLKIGQGGGGWAAAARVRATDGMGIEGLRFRAQ